MKTEGKIVFRKKIITFGNSLGIIPPKEILEYLDAKKGTEIKLLTELGKHGKYVTIWNEKQQKRIVTVFDKKKLE